ncbi:hypothetical protein EIP86_001669 [Pleurotus ostreatoroseus]|nr:hypothetical protein EIP86_001669 [Pleurotus ostreatoroseus]
MAEDGMKLPTELLLVIKELIPHSDLRTHVCYYNTCRTIAAFYGDSSEQAEFWRRACLLSGIGWLKADASWKEIAFETIARDGFCRHPGCGGALLDWNGELRYVRICGDTYRLAAKQVAHAMHLWNWDPEDGPWDGSIDYMRDGLEAPSLCPRLVCSPMFQHVTFRGDSRGTWSVNTSDIVLRYPDGGQLTELARHSVAARSHAFFPFTKKVYCDFGDDVDPYDDVQHESGITVWDMMHIMLYKYVEILIL